MAQKMIDLKNEKMKSTKATQTDLSRDFRIQLSDEKFLEMHKSFGLNEYIMKINRRKTKIVITKSMWKIITKNLDQINGVFMAS